MKGGQRWPPNTEAISNIIAGIGASMKGGQRWPPNPGSGSAVFFMAALQ